jgi:hypothetical protein
MTVIARSFISIPVRSAKETWSAICGILAPQGDSEAAKELLSVAGIASSLIAREAMISPIVVHGSGPRIRIYCLYHQEAIEGDDSNENPLSFDATAGDWKMSVPCPADDLAWVQSAFAEKTKRISARDQNSEVIVENEDTDSTNSFVLKLDPEEFFRS